MESDYLMVASAEEVQARIEQIAAQIVSEYAGKNPLFVALLRGAAPFASKLMFAISTLDPKFHPEIDYMMVSTYGDSRNAGEPHIVTDLAPTTEVSHRTAIVIDDVLDKGVTANFVFRHLQVRGAAETKLAVLAEKDVKKSFPITADYCGFSFGDKWLTGMGMDDAGIAPEAGRWLPEIWENTKA